jgi:5-methylcytosine-specific restriction endonuclease McrA
MRDFIPFTEPYDTPPEPYEPNPVVVPKRKLSGNSHRRREYVRPDESDIEGLGLWALEPAPTRSARVAEELERWFGADCHLCGDPIDMTLGGVHPGRWNVDHLVPRASGGLHVWGNLRLAHMACNGAKAHLALPEPPPWLYTMLLRYATSKYENNGIHVVSEIEWYRSEATAFVAMRDSFVKSATEGMGEEWNEMLYRVQDGLWADKWIARADDHIARLVLVQNRLVAAHDKGAP